MADRKSRRVNTNQLQPGDLIVGCEMQCIMVAPEGYLVDRIGPCIHNGCGCTMIYFKGNPNGEGFNPYWGWYVVREEKNNGKAEEGSV